jgi:pimeloyl-ACP methyl ester carboxylesterase
VPEQFRDVIVLLPGILGSQLEKDGGIIWGWSGGVLVRNLLSAGDALRAALWVETDSPTAASLDDGVRATRLLPDLHLVPGLWKIDGYGAIQRYLLDTFGLREGANFFAFPYDWRRDNRAVAIRLRDSVQQWLTDWRRQSGNDEARVILVGHSMGGLIARYFIEVLEGWRDARALITFGTPHSGSINAIDAIVNGLDKFRIDLTSVARRLNSLYQLLPTYECCETEDGIRHRLSEVRLAGLDPQRLADAMAFHEEIRMYAQRNADNDEYRRSPYDLFPIVGYNQPTYQSALVRNGRVELLQTLGDLRLSGDGTVPRQSAVPPGYTLPAAMFASSRHASLQNSGATLAHVGGVISSLYVSTDFRGATPELPVQVSLDVQDVYCLPEATAIRARPSREGTQLYVTILDHPTQSRLSNGAMEADGDGWQRFMFQPPHPGTYSVIVGGMQGMVEQARDVIEVIAGDMVAS